MTLVMGILNTTPDSFSDGGLHLDVDAAVAAGVRMAGQGAAIIDVGGESTRPGAERVSAEEERRRVLPVVRGLSRELGGRGVVVSVDTMRASTAQAAVEAGAGIVNDVSGGLADPDMLPAVAALGVKYVAMHWRGHSTVMNQQARYDDVAQDVSRETLARVEAALAAGIERGRLVVDPGLGFAKTGEQNWELLRNWREFERLGLPVLLGASRKRFLGELYPEETAAAERDAATAALSFWAATRGVWAVRVHDVPGSVAAVEMARRLGEQGRPGIIVGGGS